MSFFDIANNWDCGPIENTGSMDRLKTRAIGSSIFQFKVLDIRQRTRMGTKALSMLSKFKGVVPVVAEIFRANEDLGPDVPKEKRDQVLRNKALQMLPSVIPSVLEVMGDDDLSDYLFSLCEKASVDMDDKFVSLTNPMAQQKAFGDDLTLQIPVALTVLEVNLSDGFFGQIIAKLPSEQQTGASGNT